jgi:hypothetical protein
MSNTEKTQAKNAPLNWPKDRNSFVQWAMETPEGKMSAGYQAVHKCLSNVASEPVLRISAAKWVSLVRREQGRTPEEVAAKAGVGVVDVLAIEIGEPVVAEVVERVATALGLNGDVLMQLLGLGDIRDQALIRAAAEFVARLEPSESLDVREQAALRWFQSAISYRRTG